MATVDLDKITISTIQDKTLAEESMRKNGNVANKVSQTKPKPKGPCGHCGSGTHHESNCYQKYPEKRPGGKGKKGKGRKMRKVRRVRRGRKD